MGVAEGPAERASAPVWILAVRHIHRLCTGYANAEPVWTVNSIFLCEPTFAVDRCTVRGARQVSAHTPETPVVEPDRPVSAVQPL